jgi:hypothetical protein
LGALRPELQNLRLSRTKVHEKLFLCYNIAADSGRALNSAVECHLHTVEVIGSNPIAPTSNQLVLLKLSPPAGPRPRLLVQFREARFWASMRAGLIRAAAATFGRQKVLYLVIKLKSCEERFDLRLT